MKSRFPLLLQSPTTGSAPKMIRVVAHEEALIRYRHCHLRESFGGGDLQEHGCGELWTTEEGRVLVKPNMGRLLLTLQTVCSLGYQEARLLYSQGQQLDLHGLYEFLLLGTSLRVVVEVPEDSRSQVEVMLSNQEFEYRIPDLCQPPSTGWVTWLFRGEPDPDPGFREEVLEAARSLLWYEADRDPVKMKKTLHLLRHLNYTELCREVLEIHRSYYQDGEFETFKDYPKPGQAEQVGEHLKRLYQWAHTRGWRVARQLARVPNVPDTWRPCPPDLKPLEGPPPPAPGDDLEGLVVYRDHLDDLDQPLLESLRVGNRENLDFLLSSAAYGVLSALAAVACEPELFGAPGASALLRGCSTQDPKARKLARQWAAEAGHAQLKLDAYFHLREDQAKEVPRLCTEGTDRLSAALYLVLTGQKSWSEAEAEGLDLGDQENLSFALEHRLRLRSVPSFRQVIRAESSSFRGRIVAERIGGDVVLACTENMVVSLERLGCQISLWRPGRGVEWFETPGFYYGGVAYSVKQNLFMAVEFEQDGAEQALLYITGLPPDSNPRSLSFPCRAQNMLLSPSEKWLACWGEQGWYIFAFGQWAAPLHLNRSLISGLSFQPEERFFAVFDQDGIILFETENFVEVGRWQGFEVERITWADQHLIGQGGEEVVSCRLPDLNEVARLRAPSASLQPNWLMIPGKTEQRRYDYPFLSCSHTYPVPGESSVLTVDQKVLLLVRHLDNRSSLLAFDAHNLEEIGSTEPLRDYIENLALSPEGSFALSPRQVFSSAE